MRSLLILLVLISFFVPVFAGPCGGAIYCGCGDSITNHHTMTSDLNCSTSPIAISIGSDDVVLDCAGYSIVGDDNKNLNKIGLLNKGYDNVTIRNCSFHGFSISMFLMGRFNDPVTNNTIQNNEFQTFVNSSKANFSAIFRYATNNSFSMNNIMKSGFAINLTNSNWNDISYNTIVNNTHGIYIEQSDANTIAHNNISSNEAYGIIGWRGSDANHFLNNSLIENGIHGLTLSENDLIGTSSLKQTCEDNIIESNEICANTGHGINIRGCNRTDIKLNKVSFSAENGLSVYMSNNNLIVGNLFLNNSIYGIEYHFSTSTISDNYACANTVSDFYIDLISDNNGENNTCDNNDGWNDTGISNCTTSCYLGPKCSDSTPWDHCSETKPLFCDDGELVYDCTICGCPEGRICSEDSKGCETPAAILNECQDSTVYGECSVNKPLFCDDGELVYDCELCGCSDSHECNVTTGFCDPSCEDGTPYGRCSVQLPLFCSNGTMIDLCGSCGCGDGTYCDYTDNGCHLKKSDLSDCKYNRECENGNCFHDLCRPSHYICDHDDDCSSTEYCNRGLCYQKNPAGGNCTTDNRCLSGHCVDNNCIECFDTSECGADQRCDDYVCVPIGITLTLSEEIFILLGITMSIVFLVVIILFIKFTKKEM